MDNKIKLKECRIAIIGLGLMGGSLALALRGKVKSILGIENDPTTLSSAFNQKIIDRGEQKLTPALHDTDIIILALPIKSICDTVPRLPEFISIHTLILDLGSTKRVVMDAFSALPQAYQRIGGHPMCGKSIGGLTSAEPDLYKGATFALVKSDHTQTNSKQLAETLVHAVGAHPIWISAETHDTIAAGVSHLPYLLSCALVQTTPMNFKSLIGPGFRSTSRLASTPGSMMDDILETNQDQIILQLDSYIANLEHLRDLIAEGKFRGLSERLAHTATKQKSLLSVNESSQADEN